MGRYRNGARTLDLGLQVKRTRYTAGGGVDPVRIRRLTGKLSILVRGQGWTPHCCRPAGAWKAMLERLGFEVAQEPMSAGTPLANVLLIAAFGDCAFFLTFRRAHSDTARCNSQPDCHRPGSG